MFCLCGCGGTGRFVYPENYSSMAMVVGTSPRFPGKVAVMPFVDCRSGDNLGITVMLAFIPGCPFGFREYERPESAGSFTTLSGCDIRPDEELAKAAVTSLKRSGLFRDAYFTYGGEAGAADYVLEGDIRSTYYKGRTLTYGCSVYGLFFWVVGAPVGTSLNRLSLALRLKDRTGAVVWSYSFDHDDYLVQGLYYRNGSDVSLYARLMQQGMNDAIRDLAAGGRKEK